RIGRRWCGSLGCRCSTRRPGSATTSSRTATTCCDPGRPASAAASPPTTFGRGWRVKVAKIANLTTDGVRRPYVKMVRCVGRWYNGGKETAMIELTEQQVQALESPDANPPRVVNPRTQETFVLLRVEEYERLKEEEYDDSPWT